jgi:hypothetical protein
MEKYNPSNIYDQAFSPPYAEPKFSGEENNVIKFSDFGKYFLFIFSMIYD